MTQAFPLQWPMGRPRAKTRKRALFSKKVDTGRGWAETKDLTVADALRRIQDELDRLGARQYVLSSNIETRLDGLPRSGQAEPKDPGAALYFHLAGKPHCLPCDTFDRVADNIAAIAKHIEATRAIERYGVATLADMFAGFTSLPAPTGKRHWRQVLDFDASRIVSKDDIDSRFKALSKQRHPDMPGGSDAAMSELNRARAEALHEIGERTSP